MKIPTVQDIAGLPIERLPTSVRVVPVTKPFDITVRPPGSKSITNRALLLAALSHGQSVLTGALVDAEDAQVMIAALRTLGAQIDITPEVDQRGESSGNATVRVQGVGGRWKINPGQQITLNLQNAGTATRFLTAAAILQPKESGGIIIDGNARMRQRPIGELVDALRSVGVEVEHLFEEGFPPLLIRPFDVDLVSGLKFRFGESQSGQFVSAVLLLGPFVPGGIRVQMVDAPITSPAYVRLTMGLLRDCHIEPKFDARRSREDALRFDTAKNNEIFVQASPVWRTKPRYVFSDYLVEADASSACHICASAVVVPKSRCTVVGRYPTVYGARRERVVIEQQPDSWFLLSLDELGKYEYQVEDVTRWTIADVDQPRAMQENFSLFPDAAMTAAVIACFASGPSTLTGLRTLRVKETDRIQALVNELGKVGVKVEPFAYVEKGGQADEGIRITPPVGGIDCSPNVPMVEFETYDDHRMAMSLALIGLRRPNVIIRDPACVRKTYPTFWRDLAKVYGG